MNLADIRKDYGLKGLHEADVSANPFTQFQTWFDQAISAGVVEPNAMTLATCTPDGFPSARIVLLKGFDSRGLQFFSNYESRKGVELLNNPQAALVFFWPDLERQIRIEGRVERTTEAESDGYYHSRPRNSRLGAWASLQSSVISGREELETKQRELDARYAGEAVPRPPHWGGFRVVPLVFEFWQGRPSRLHDRLRYRLAEGRWIIERLSP
ncbi:pyridoxamine 5'-phosphate oxidase [Zavarzinella formosa]|uniref:pyridoxamine 5'-phosphate oxidase n=1 Tax=Zavarzinella formosa TaxID=360055 RepID=UPI0002E4D812|nr:pyridoxamine 5'-phosphate oxidase [Zavarzinella formosa]